MSKIYQSPYTLDIPNIDVISYVFSRGTSESRSAPQYFDAAQPIRHYSLTDAETYVKQIALGLKSLGMGAQDKVMMYSNNDLYVPILFWATIAAECVFTACSPTASVKELVYQAHDSKARIIFASPELLTNALAAAAELGLPADCVYVFKTDFQDGDPLKELSWERIWASKEDAYHWHWRKITSKKELQETTAVINYSSGTTGTPKGVEISHYNVIANSVQLVFKRSLIGSNSEAQSRNERLARSGERWLAPLPMFHAYGQMYYCINAPSSSAKVYIMRKFNLEQMVLFVDIYRITFMTCVPTILHMLGKLKNPKRFNFTSVESVLTGSAPLSPELGKLVEDHLFAGQGIQIKQGWGMTETTCSCSGFAQDDENDATSVGWLNPNCKAKVVLVDGRDFKQSTPAGAFAGELWISGPNVMKGYYQRPAETKDAFVFEDGQRWLKTGDIAFIDDRGYIHIIDRLKELIKVKGLQVSPAEVEQILIEHPGVDDAAVVGMFRDGEEYVQAFVKRAVGHSPVTKEEIFRFIKHRLAKHKWPTGGIHFVEAIPRTGSGKVQRRFLPNTKPISNKL